MIKKISIIVIAFLSVISFSSCDKESLGDNHDFSNILPPYVGLKSKEDVTVEKGDEVSFVIQSRTSLQQNSVITYSVSGVVTLANQTATLLKDKTSVTVKFTVPTTAAAGEAVVMLTAAAKEDGSKLTLGSDNVPANQKFTVIVE